MFIWNSKNVTSASNLPTIIVPAEAAALAVASSPA
jgi:hypothetical protein